MKLLTFDGEAGLRLGALLDGNHVVDLEQANRQFGNPDLPAFASLLALIQAGEAALDTARKTMEQVVNAGDEKLRTPLEQVRLRSPVPQPPRLRCFSVYERHMTQSIEAVVRSRVGRVGVQLNKLLHFVKVPKDFYRSPPYYKGNPISVIGHDDPVPWPSFAETKLDYEIELGLFIGVGGQDISRADAMQHVFGYTVYNDFSARDRLLDEIMHGSLGPIKGKDFEGGNSIGPWVVTRDEIPNPQNLTMVVRVNDEVMARTSTREMYYGIDAMIERAAEGERLVPGEFIATGAAADGTGIERWLFLAPGDVVELEIESIGKLRNTIA